MLVVVLVRVADLQLPFRNMRQALDGKDFYPWLVGRLNRPVAYEEIDRALGVSKQAGRKMKREDFPNNEECALLARHFGFDPIKLRIQFGLLNPEELRDYAELLGIECKSLRQDKPKRQPNPRKVSN